MAKERPPLEEMTLRQLRKVASEYGISRYSRMRKAQLLAEIQKIQRTKALPVYLAQWRHKKKWKLQSLN
jgi:transcription termination factor Rho